MKSILTLTTVAFLVTVGSTSVMASAKTHGYKGQELAGKAKVSLAQARGIALKAHPGRVTDQELEKEPGGSGLRYSFDISTGGKPYEVGVDATTGAVLENKAEGKNPD